MLQRPEQHEYAPYYGTYIQLVPEGNLIQLLDDQLDAALALLSGLSEEEAAYRYAPGKWSIKEVIGHITDTERIMAYRLLRIARGDTTELPGFDQDIYISGASFDQCSLPFLLEDLTVVRRATLTLVKGLSEEAWRRQGVASSSPFTARALACVISGHELHHLKVLQERYGLK
ncbi:DinB family protein [Paenibacillus sp. NPDC056579]|uniref:DinB family protein n=1 Tax=unclassified Paenibacillus TaxID=185978 RepID=UPI001EF92C94|nr:DinB family protein [Paenibacillus sp. H1-7]ULL19143.1 DinB family protein [Paenibacillus sp. H1-7]